MDTALTAGRLHSSLLLEQVVPTLGWGADLPPVSLTVGLREFCLLEGVSVHHADQLFRVVATLQLPAAGRLWHWGRDLFALSRRQLYQWRRRLAFVSPRHALLPRLTLRDNLALTLTLSRARRQQTGLAPHQPLLEQLELTGYLELYPRQLPPRCYQLALWARELLQEPQLLLGILAGQEEPQGAPKLAPLLLPLLTDFHRQRRGALLLAGPWLAPFHLAADRRLLFTQGRWQEESLARDHPHPLAAYLHIL